VRLAHKTGISPGDKAAARPYIAAIRAATARTPGSSGDMRTLCHRVATHAARRP